MATLVTLALALRANLEGFTSQMEAGSNVVKGFERSHLSLKQVVEQTMTTEERYRQQIEQLSAWLDKGKISQEQYERAVEKAKQAMQGGGEGASAYAAGFAKLAERASEFIIEAASIERVAELFKNTFEQTGEIGRTAERLGVTAEEMSRLEHAANATHIEIGTLTGGIDKLNRAIGEAATGGQGAKGMSEAFARLNLDVRKLIDESPAQAFQDVSEALEHVGTAAERAAIIREIFGRSGTELLPLMTKNLRELGDESDRLNFTRTAVDVQAAEEAEHQMANATDALRGSVAHLVTEISPWISAMAEAGVELVQNTELLLGFDREAQRLQAAKTGFAESADQVKRLRQELKDATDAQERLNLQRGLLNALEREREAGVEAYASAGPGDVAPGSGLLHTLAVQIKEARDALGPMESAAKAHAAAQADAARETKQHSDEIVKLVGQLEEQIAAFGESKAGLEAYRIEMAGADPVTMLYAESLATMRDTLEAAKKAEDEAARVTDQHKRSLADLTTHLEDETSVLGKTRGEIELLKAAHLGADAATQQHIKHLLELKESQENWKKYTDQVERYREKIAELTQGPLAAERLKLQFEGFTNNEINRLLALYQQVEGLEAGRKRNPTERIRSAEVSPAFRIGGPSGADDRGERHHQELIVEIRKHTQFLQDIDQKTPLVTQ